MSSKGNPWFDKWAKLAKEKGYPARSVFKLMEIQKKYKLIRPGFRVLDLGASPGSWSQYACEIVGPLGKVVGVDLEPVKFSSKLFTFIQKDIFELTMDDFRALGIEEFDLILSDMAPKTTGIEVTDHVRSVELVHGALELSKTLLRKGGSMVVKIFDGPELTRVRKEFEKIFKNVIIFRPSATRKGSKELFILAINKL
ncbi:MAG: RlmE family RNA methyltransferase [Caldimicrobium sp.]|nr:RlmE family RNA methyltransferase [Caldimicrobium sp.]